LWKGAVENHPPVEACKSILNLVMDICVVRAEAVDRNIYKDGFSLLESRRKEVVHFPYDKSYLKRNLWFGLNPNFLL
jgi:hypothetical protein